jgi:hypothetical protein
MCWRALRTVTLRTARDLSKDIALGQLEVLMRPYRDVATLAGAQIVCFLILTHLEPSLFLVHFYEAILYIAILVMLFYMEDRWAYMIGILASVAWLVLAYVSGIFGASIRELSRLRIPASSTNLVALAALVTALIAVLMIASCGRHWMKEYSGLGKTSSTFFVSLGCVAVYYGILGRFFWAMIPTP